ncbi:MAG: hypothetical protein IJ677_01315 [Alphaproteobacteria bacterium]|nr:hypothetical protein [Alphaproteobacteria bacterium]
MEKENNIKRPRKLLKIKRSRPLENPPASFGMPTKVNTILGENSEYRELSNNENYFADNGDAENIHFVTEEELATATPDSIKVYLQNKTVLMMLIIAAMIGAIFSYMLTPTQQTQASRGLDGIVFNPDVPAGKSRCGLVEPHQGCVLYIMNPKNQEVTGKDFYTTAAKWTGRERYLIDTSNMHYASTRIKPGYIAQIYVPSLSY